MALEVFDGTTEVVYRLTIVPDGDDVSELLQALMNIFDMVRRLPPGDERISADAACLRRSGG